MYTFMLLVFKPRIFFIFEHHINYEEPKRDLTINDDIFYELI